MSKQEEPHFEYSRENSKVEDVDYDKNQDEGLQVPSQDASPPKDRYSTNYDPFDPTSVYAGEDKNFIKRGLTKMNPDSLRTGMMTLISSILGPGLIVVPHAMTYYGYINGMIMISLAAICQFFTFKFFGFCQAKCKDSEV